MMMGIPIQVRHKTTTEDCMRDIDGDGYGDMNVSGDIVAGTDCNDVAPTINPNAGSSSRWNRQQLWCTRSLLHRCDGDGYGSDADNDGDGAIDTIPSTDMACDAFLRSIMHLIVMTVRRMSTQVRMRLRMTESIKIVMVKI